MRETAVGGGESMVDERQSVTQVELIRRLEEGYATVEAFLATLSDDELQAPGVVGDWSVHDLLAHFIAHEQRALAELGLARRGDRLASDDAAVDAFNAGAVMAWRGLASTVIRRAWAGSAWQVVAAVAALDEADFAPHSPLATALGDTLDGALANNTYAHYAAHLPAMVAWHPARS